MPCLAPRILFSTTAENQGSTLLPSIAPPRHLGCVGPGFTASGPLSRHHVPSTASRSLAETRHNVTSVCGGDSKAAESQSRQRSQQPLEKGVSHG